MTMLAEIVGQVAETVGSAGAGGVIGGLVVKYGLGILAKLFTKNGNGNGNGGSNGKVPPPGRADACIAHGERLGRIETKIADFDAWLGKVEAKLDRALERRRESDGV